MPRFSQQINQLLMPGLFYLFIEIHSFIHNYIEKSILIIYQFNTNVSHVIVRNQCV